MTEPFDDARWRESESLAVAGERAEAAGDVAEAIDRYARAALLARAFARSLGEELPRTRAAALGMAAALTGRVEAMERGEPPRRQSGAIETCRARDGQHGTTDEGSDEGR